ncbi:undecaprenyl-diphosphate phosphatase [Candidatus Bathyarchaeota archaeon]|nr:undecaprenyl-diphosphate phosphatase [Candidatus Bathyarchaeota archaeon]
MYSETMLIILGAIQGVVEWLPISSSGILMLLMTQLLGVESFETLNLSIFLHIGTGAAALVYFNKEAKRILLRKTEQNLLTYLIVSTIVTGAVGLCLYLLFNEIDMHGEYLTVLIGFALIFNGIIQKSTHAKNLRDSRSLTCREGILIGLVQGLSIIPGISRSGITTSILVFKGFSASEALRISFLMSIPVIFTSAIGLALIRGFSELSFEPMVLTVLVSFVSGIFSIGRLLRVARKVQFWLFCIILGVLALTPLLLYGIVDL